MEAKSHDHLKVIRFEGELLPTWAQLLDLAAGLCSVPEDTRRWFSKFTNSSGADDARTVLFHCELLQSNIQEHRELILADLQETGNKSQPFKIVSAWIYTLETMVQVAQSKKTCSWIVEGANQTTEEHLEGGDISLRRV